MPFDVTYHFSDGPGNTASGTQVSQNFTDVTAMLEAMLATYSPFARAAALQTSSAGAATFLMSLANVPASNITPTTASGVPNLHVIDIDPALYAISGRTTVLRLKLAVVPNAVAPAITFTAGLYPISTYGGASGVEPTVASLGTVVSGSTVAIASPGAAARTVATGADFTMPSAGAYALAVATTGFPAAGSFNDVHVNMSMRRV